MCEWHEAAAAVSHKKGHTQIQLEECGKLLLTFSGYEDFMVNGFFNEIVKCASLHLNFFSFSSNSQFCLGYILFISNAIIGMENEQLYV